MATGTERYPEGLMDPLDGAVVEQEWERSLAHVADPALRDHLRMLCLTPHWARSEGAYYCGTGRCPGDLERIEQQPGHTFVTGWEFGEGQAATAIFAVTPHAQPTDIAEVEQME